MIIPVNEKGRRNWSFFVIQQKAVHLRTIVQLSKFSRKVDRNTVLYWCRGKCVQGEREDNGLKLRIGKIWANVRN